MVGNTSGKGAEQAGNGCLGDPRKTQPAQERGLGGGPGAWFWGAFPQEAAAGLNAEATPRTSMLTVRVRLNVSSVPRRGVRGTPDSLRRKALREIHRRVGRY